MAHEGVSPALFHKERRRRLTLLLRYAKELELSLWCPNSEIKLRTQNNTVAVEIDVLDCVRADDLDWQ